MDEKDGTKGVEYPFVEGSTSSSCKWKDVEPAQGKFNFTGCRATIEFAQAHDQVVMLSPETGSNAPLNWLPDAGVPIVQVCDHNWKKDPKKCPSSLVSQFPFYTAPAYHGLWRNYHQKLHDFVKALPKELAETVVTVQDMQGATGDMCPWHGTAVDPKQQIGANSDTWRYM